MSKKIVKLKQSDLIKRVRQVIKEQEEEKDATPLTVMQGEDGTYYVVDQTDPHHPKLVMRTK